MNNPQDFFIVLMGCLLFAWRVYRLFRLGSYVTRSVASKVNSRKGATPSGTTQCPQCRQNVPVRDYPAHMALHTQQGAAGPYPNYQGHPFQQNPASPFQQSYPPSTPQQAYGAPIQQQSYTGSLDGVPRTYYHPVCKTSTQMPEETIRTYLVNPFAFQSSTFCAGCQTYVPLDQVFWTETRENVGQYMGRLQTQARGSQQAARFIQQ